MEGEKKFVAILIFTLWLKTHTSIPMGVPTLSTSEVTYSQLAVLQTAFPNAQAALDSVGLVKIQSRVVVWQPFKKC
jgi:hypothetical protein